MLTAMLIVGKSSQAQTNQPQPPSPCLQTRTSNLSLPISANVSSPRLNDVFKVSDPYMAALANANAALLSLFAVTRSMFTPSCYYAYVADSIDAAQAFVNQLTAYAAVLEMQVGQHGWGRTLHPLLVVHNAYYFDLNKLLHADTPLHAAKI